MNPGKVVHPYRLDANLRLGADFAPAEPADVLRLPRRRRTASRQAVVALRRRRQVPQPRAAAVMCPSLPGDPGGGALHPRPGPAAVRDARAARSSPTAGARPRCATRSTCAWPARAARPTVRSTSTWPPTRRSSSPTTTRHRLRPAAHYSMGWLPVWARLAARSRRVLVNAAQRTPRARPRWPSGWPASPSSGSCRRFAAQTLQRLVARPPAAARLRRTRPGRCCGRTRSPTHFHPAVARAAVARAGGRRASRSACPTEPVCCGLTWVSTGQLATAKRVLRRTLERPAPRHPRTGPGRRAGTELHRGVPGRRARAAARTTRTCSRLRAADPSRWPSCSPSTPRTGSRPGWTRQRHRPDPLPPARGPRLRRRTRHLLAPRRASMSSGSTPAAAGSPATSASSAATTRSPRPCAERVLLPRVRSCRPRDRGARRRLQLPHPDRAGRHRPYRRPPRRAARRRCRRPPARRPAGACSRRPAGRPARDIDPDHATPSPRRTDEPDRRRPRPRSACASGGSSRSSATPATASTGCSRPGSAPRTSRGSCRPGTRRWPPSRPSATPSSPAGSASAWRPRARAPSTCSTACTTPSSTTCRWSPIVGQTNRVARWAAATSRRSTCSACSRTSPATTCQMVTVPEQLPNVLDRAIRIACARRTVTAVIIPADVQELEYSPPAHAFKMVPSSLGP